MSLERKLTTAVNRDSEPVQFRVRFAEGTTPFLDETKRRQRAAFGYTHALREASRKSLLYAVMQILLRLLLRTYLGGISTGR